jgi:hypothetical protein
VGDAEEVAISVTTGVLVVVATAVDEVCEDSHLLFRGLADTTAREETKSNRLDRIVMIFLVDVGCGMQISRDWC